MVDGYTITVPDESHKKALEGELLMMDSHSKVAEHLVESEIVVQGNE